MDDIFRGEFVRLAGDDTQTIAEACPLPGISVFHRARRTSQFVGTFCSMQVPSPRGPRQAGQDSPLAVIATVVRSPENRTTTVRSFFVAVIVISISRLAYLSSTRSPAKPGVCD